MSNSGPSNRLHAWSLSIGIATLALMVSLAVYQTWTLENRIGPKFSGTENIDNDYDDVLSSALAWLSVVLFLIAPIVGGALGIASLVRERARIWTAISGLVLNALCASVFVFFAYLLVYSGV